MNVVPDITRLTLKGMHSLRMSKNTIDHKNYSTLGIVKIDN